MLLRRHVTCLLPAYLQSYLILMSSITPLPSLPPPGPFFSRPQHAAASIAVPRCTSSTSGGAADVDADGLPVPPETTTSFSVTKRVPSGITRERLRAARIAKPEPPNFQIGWKRTKPINVEKPKGWAIADVMEKLEGLMARGRYGSGALLRTVAAVVVERAWVEAEIVQDMGDVDERRVTELGRVLRLVEMDVEMVKAAVKEDTVSERLQVARARCRQAILLALSL